ncbi:MAG: hypothetical protein NT010_05005 [Proteobacteria bacterium]|nr:hypothetical protein [Pseudomonadota bacterium]
MAELYSVDKKPNKETIDEIIAGLEAMGNYIPTSEVTRREYRNVLLKEYEEFIETHDKENETHNREKNDKMCPNAPDRETGK